MELEIIKQDDSDRSDHLIKNVPDKVWNEFRRLARINGLTVSKMFEVLIITSGDD